MRRSSLIDTTSELLADGPKSAADVAADFALDTVDAAGDALGSAADALIDGADDALSYLSGTIFGSVMPGAKRQGLRNPRVWVAIAVAALLGALAVNWWRSRSSEDDVLDDISTIESRRA